MGAIRDAGNVFLREYVTEGLPASGQNHPAKLQGRAAFGVIEDTVQAVQQGQQSGIIGYATWAELAAHPTGGLTAGAVGKVFNDAGTHTDPVVGGTVDNQGVFRWSAAPAGWQRIANLEADDAAGYAAAAAATLAAVQAEYNAPYNAVDEASDLAAPWFVNTAHFTKSRKAPTAAAQASVASRDSDTQLTLASGGSGFVEGGAMVVQDGTTGEITSHLIKSVAGNVITTYEPLPVDPDIAEAMHKADLDPHLSRLSYKGLADFLIAQSIRYSYRKSVLFEYHGPASSSVAFNDPDIYDFDGDTKLIEVTELGSAGGGGFVAGTANLAKFCTQDAANRGYGVEGGDYLARGYLLQDGIAGNGFSFTVPLAERNGFLEIAIGGIARDYLTSPGNAPARTSGDYRVKVTTDAAVELHNEVYKTGELKSIFVDFSGAESVDVEVTLEDDEPTSVTLYSLYAYGKSPNTPTSPILEEGDVVAFLGDSWTQFPLVEGMETPPDRPDGSTGDGMQFFSERLRERMAELDMPITTLNMGKGGTTTAWGKYWLNTVINLTPKPNKCVVLFGINDADSVDEYAADSDSAFDFDLDDQWAFLVKSSGGVKGSVSYALWYRYLQIIAAHLAGAGIKPIIMMPGHIASDATGQNIRDNELGRIARGFRA